MSSTTSEKIAFVQRVFGRVNIYRDNIEVWCPFCAPKDKNHRKLTIKLDGWLNHCWVCDHKAGSLIPLIKQFGSRSDLNEYIEKFAPELIRRARIEVEADKAQEVELPRDFRLLTQAKSFRDPDVRAILKYLVTDRGFTQRDLWLHKLGYSNESRWRRRVIVPSFDASGRVNCFTARAVDKCKYSERYDGPPVDRRQIVWNEINVDWLKPVVICEGPFDAVKCGDNAIPLCGSTLNSRSLLFNMLTLHASKVFLALDPDAKFKKTLKMAKLLSQYCVETHIVDVQPFKDPGEMTREQFREALERAVKFDWRFSLSEKLAAIT